MLSGETVRNQEIMWADNLFDTRKFLMPYMMLTIVLVT